MNDSDKYKPSRRKNIVRSLEVNACVNVNNTAAVAPWRMAVSHVPLIWKLHCYVYWLISCWTWKRVTTESDAFCDTGQVEQLKHNSNMVHVGFYLFNQMFCAQWILWELPKWDFCRPEAISGGQSTASNVNALKAKSVISSVAVENLGLEYKDV